MHSKNKFVIPTQKKLTNRNVKFIRIRLIESEIISNQKTVELFKRYLLNDLRFLTSRV